MEFTAENLPFLSLICLPAVAFLARTLFLLKESALQQDADISSNRDLLSADISATREWLKNLDSAMARRSELMVLGTKIDSLSARIDRAEDTIDRLRNGLRK